MNINPVSPFFDPRELQLRRVQHYVMELKVATHSPTLKLLLNAALQRVNLQIDVERLKEIRRRTA